MSAPGPRPWVAKLENRIARDGVEVFAADGERVFYVTPDDTMEVADGMIVECLSPEQKANLRHVLTCVNAHEDLLAACEKAIREGWVTRGDLADEMRAAIAKARGGK